MTASAPLLDAIDVLPEPMLVASLDGLIDGINQALARELGVTGKRVAGHRLTAALVDEPEERVSEFLRACARSGQMVLGALAIRDGNGASRRFRAQGVAYRGADGSAQRILIRLTPKPESVAAFLTLNEKIAALSAEIARRKHSEALLAREHETLRVTLRSIGDAVIVTDAQGAVTFMNPVAEQLTGRTATESLHKPLDEVFPIANETTGETVENPVGKVLATGHIVGLANHTVLIRSDAHRIPIDDSAAPIRLADGTLSGVVLIFRDITQRRRVERERLEADRRKDEFLAVLAHELRNPLAPIRNALQIMHATEGDAAVSTAARTIVDRQLRHLTRLIDDLLDISRITHGKIELRKERTALSNVIQLALEIVRPHLEAKGHPLNIELASEGLYLHGDPNRLGQVFANLLHNASKYSAAGAPIGIEAAIEGEQLVVRIVDQGVGIPNDMRERIFEPFQQAREPESEAQGGLGVGLSLVKRIVELHDGSVRAESAGRDRGSEFIVTLPRARPPEEYAQPARTASPKPGTRPLRILIADDNRDAAQTLAMMLMLQGHHVRETYDGSAALEAGDEFRPELVVLDIGMPVLDGYETARRIRQRPWGRQAHLVALTGWGQASDRQKAMAAGFHDHLVKPADFEALNTVIQRLAGGTT